MTPGDYDITIYQGQTFVRELEILDTTMQGVDLTGYEAKMQIRDAKDVTSNLVATLHSDLSQILSSVGATGGTFTLTFGLKTTAPIPFNATALQVKNALELLPNIGFNNIYASGGPLPALPINISFVGPFIHKNQQLLVADDSALIGDPINVLEPQKGRVYVNAAQTLTMIGAIGGTFTLTFKGQTTDTLNPLNWNATNNQIQTAFEALSSVQAGNTALSGGPINIAPVTITFVGNLGKTPQPSITVDDHLLLGGPVSSAMTVAGVFPVNAKQKITNVGANSGTFTLQFKNNETGLLAWNATRDQIANALLNLSTIGSTGGLPNIQFTSDSAASLDVGPVIVEFINAMKWQKQPKIIVTNANFSNGNLSITNQTLGVLSSNTMYSLQGGGTGTHTFTLSITRPDTSVVTTGAISDTATPATIAAAIAATASIGSANVSVTGAPLPSQALITLQGTLGNYAGTITVNNTSGGMVTATRVITGGGGSSGVNAVQMLSLSNADAGYFTLRFTNPFTLTTYTTNNIPFDASSSEIQAALSTLPGIAFSSLSNPNTPIVPTLTVTKVGSGADNLNVSNMLLTFGGTLGLRPIALLTAPSTFFSKGSVTMADSGAGTQTGVPPVSAVQTLTQGPSRRGSFTLTFNGVTTDAIPYNATAQNIANAFAAKGIIDITVAGGPFQTVPSDSVLPIIINFINSLSNQPVSPITANNSQLVGGPIVISNTVVGVSPLNEIQLLEAGAVTNGTFTIKFNGQPVYPTLPTPLNYNATAGEIQTALSSIPGVGNGNIIVTAMKDSTPNSLPLGSDGHITTNPMKVEFVGSLAGSPQPLLVIDSSLLTNQTAIVVKPPNDGFILIDPSTSTLTLKMFADKTSTFSWTGNKYYDLKLISPNGDVERLFQGKVYLDQQVTSDEIFVGTPQPELLPNPMEISEIFSPREAETFPVIRTRYRVGT